MLQDVGNYSNKVKLSIGILFTTQILLALKLCTLDQAYKSLFWKTKSSWRWP